MTSDELVRTETVGRTLVITLNRPDKRNAVDRALADALDVVFNQLDDDPDLWCGVLAAEGPVFCAGSDLSSNGDYYTDRGGEYALIRRDRRKPLIAAVDGPALGGGLEIVLACDIVVASSNAQFGLPEVKRGLIPTCAGLFRGPRALPPNIAMELALSGVPMSAERAHHFGLVNYVVEPGQVRDAAEKLAEVITGNAPVAVQAARRAMAHYLAANDDEGWELTDQAKQAIAQSADREEGVRAFFEKRPPQWTGR